LADVVSERESRLNEANRTIEELRLSSHTDTEAKLAAKDRHIERLQENINQLE
jgi:hypothetical protein